MHSGVEGISSGISLAECLNFSNVASGIFACNLRNLAGRGKGITTWQKLCMGYEKRKGYFHNLLHYIRVSPHFCRNGLNHPSTNPLSHFTWNHTKETHRTTNSAFPNSFAQFQLIKKTLCNRDNQIEDGR